jgi:hypothetical protein
VLSLIRNARLWNILFRTAHLGAMGVLLGGHAFDMPPERLYTALGCTIATGAALGALEAWGSTIWFHQGRGLLTLAKLALLLLVPVFWDQRLAILAVVVVLAGVGSHMPAKFRYYSVVYRRVLRCHEGPGVSRIEQDPQPDAAREADCQSP